MILSGLVHLIELEDPGYSPSWGMVLKDFICDLGYQGPVVWRWDRSIVADNLTFNTNSSQHTISQYPNLRDGRSLLCIDRLKHQEGAPKVPPALQCDTPRQPLLKLKLFQQRHMFHYSHYVLNSRRRNPDQQRPTLDRGNYVCSRVGNQYQPQVWRVLLHCPPQRCLGIPAKVIGFINDHNLKLLPRGEVDLLRLAYLLE